MEIVLIRHRQPEWMLNDEYTRKKMRNAESNFGYSDLKISGTWQKFLPFYPEIIYFAHFRCSEGEMIELKKDAE